MEDKKGVLSSNYNHSFLHLTILHELNEAYSTVVIYVGNP